MTKGDPLYLTIFNVVVDAVVSMVLLEVCGPKVVSRNIMYSI